MSTGYAGYSKSLIERISLLYWPPLPSLQLWSPGVRRSGFPRGRHLPTVLAALALTRVSRPQRGWTFRGWTYRGWRYRTWTHPGPGSGSLSLPNHRTPPTWCQSPPDLRSTSVCDPLSENLRPCGRFARGEPAREPTLPGAAPELSPWRGLRPCPPRSPRHSPPFALRPLAHPQEPARASLRPVRSRSPCPPGYP